MDTEVIGWLLDGPAWLKYAVELQLLDSKPDTQPVLHDSSMISIMHRLRDNQVGIPALKTRNVSYKETGKVYWDLFFLADIGLTVKDLGLHKEIEEFFNLQLPDGTFINEEGNEPNYFCVSAILLSSVAKIGYKNDPRLEKYVQFILDTQRLDGGWHCAESRAVGQELQHTESCPMDNLNILMLLGQYEKYRNDSRFNGAIDLLLAHWERRNENWRPADFGIGKRFMSLAYPAVKYGILRVLDVVSLFPYAIKRQPFIDMLDFITKKSSNGKYFAESASESYVEFDFGQTKEPSRWITFLINRIEKRAGECE